MQVGSPARDAIFRTHPDRRLGWLKVNLVVVAKGMKETNKSADKKVYLAGPRALENPAGKERARDGWAGLLITREGVTGGWLLADPDETFYPNSHATDDFKWRCAIAATERWHSLYWDERTRSHVSAPCDLAGAPNERPAWPGENPLTLLVRTLGPMTIND